MDEWFERLIDRLCIWVPEKLRLSFIRMAGHPLGWRFALLISRLRDGWNGFFSRVRTDDDMDLFLREVSERVHVGRLRGAPKHEANRVRKAGDAGFSFLLLVGLFALSLAGLVQGDRRLMALLSLSIFCRCIAAGLEGSSLPILKAVRQKYIAAMLWNAASFVLLLGANFWAYAVDGIVSNLILQSAMLITVAMHLILFFACVAFNRRQNGFLRLLSGLLGNFSALALAAALAHCAASFSVSGTQGMLVLVGMLGVGLLFLADQLEMLVRLGGVRFPWDLTLTRLLPVLGYFLVLLGAWRAV